MKKASSYIMVLFFFMFFPGLLFYSGESIGHSREQEQAKKETDNTNKAGQDKEIQKEEKEIGISIPDLLLLNQDGEKIRFYSDLVKDKVVAINFIFTTCTTACPLLSATFSNVQELMGDRFGRDVYLISISVDPVVDTPERLKAMATKFHARPGWTFVTGESLEISQLLKALGASALRKKDHTPLVLIGNDTRGIWTRTYGLAQPVQIERVIDSMIKR